MENPVKKKYSMFNSDFNVLGEEMGYEWNLICKEIKNYELYGMDGIGYLYLDRDELDFYIETYGIMGKIISKIFEMNPEANEIYILNE